MPTLPNTLYISTATPRELRLLINQNVNDMIVWIFQFCSKKEVDGWVGGGGMIWGGKSAHNDSFIIDGLLKIYLWKLHSQVLPMPFYFYCCVIIHERPFNKAICPNSFHLKLQHLEEIWDKYFWQFIWKFIHLYLHCIQYDPLPNPPLHPPQKFL